MKIRPQKVIIPLLLMAVATFVFFKFQVNEVPRGEPAPDFESELVSGEAFQLSDLRGKYVLLHFWGSWCRPCRLESPEVVAMYARYHGKEYEDADGFEVVSVALEKRPEAAEQAASRDGMNWPYQIVEGAFVVRASDIGAAYGVTDIPANFLIDPQGNILEYEKLNEMEQHLIRNQR